MADKSAASDQSTESGSAADSAATENASSGDSSKSAKKLLSTYTLHPLQDKGIKYVSFMLSDTAKPVTAAEFVKEAIARHLAFVQKQGIEYPPKMLADMTRLHLIK